MSFNAIPTVCDLSYHSSRLLKEAIHHYINIYYCCCTKQQNQHKQEPQMDPYEEVFWNLAIQFGLSSAHLNTMLIFSTGLLVSFGVTFFVYHIWFGNRSMSGANKKAQAMNNSAAPALVKNKTDTRNNINNKTSKRQRGPVCPFSAETNFLVEQADHMSPAPLDLLESWSDPNSPDFGKPLAARWLQAGISGQDTPGLLRAGLKRMRDSKFFLVEEPFRMEEELTMKKQALDDPKRFPNVFVAEEDSLKAQEETLELFLGYLPKRYPDLYQYDPKAGTIHVFLIDTTFVLDDWKERPLELCERIVQEDLVLMRPPRDGTDEKQYVLAAAAVVFSFSELAQKLSKPAAFMHAPVPGYDKHIRKSMDLTFSKLLKVEQPMWRNNWGISPSGKLDEPLYGGGPKHVFGHLSSSSDQREDNSEEAVATSKRTSSSIIESAFLVVEYQTIRRLPQTGYLLFTVKTMSDPIGALSDLPQAARCLATSIRGMSPAIRGYKGIKDEKTCQVVLEYLDSI